MTPELRSYGLTDPLSSPTWYHINQFVYVTYFFIRRVLLAPPSFIKNSGHSLSVLLFLFPPLLPSSLNGICEYSLQAGGMIYGFLLRS